MSSPQNRLHLSSCYCYGYRFWGGGPIAFQGFAEISIFKTGSEVSRSCFVGVRCFGNSSYSFHGALMSFHAPFMLHSFPVIFLSFACIFLSFCIHFLHLPFICIHFFHFPFRFLSCSFQCAFMSFHLPFILHSFPFISFLRLWKWLYGLARGPSATNGYR